MNGFVAGVTGLVVLALLPSLFFGMVPKGAHDGQQLCEMARSLGEVFLAGCQSGDWRARLGVEWFVRWVMLFRGDIEPASGGWFPAWRS